MSQPVVAPTVPDDEANASKIMRDMAWMGLKLLLLIAGVLIASIAYSSYTGTSAIPNQDRATDLVVLLAPFIAIATAIERFLESAFNMYERYALEAVRLIGHSKNALSWMRVERDQAQRAMNAIVSERARLSNDDALADSWNARFQAAEQRLLDAQMRISESLKSPEYITIKRSITMIAGLLIGLGVATFAKLTLLNTAGFAVPAAVDVVITGLLIGSGPGPLHDFIGIIKEFRNSLASLADLAQGTAVKRAMEAVRETTTAAPAAAQRPSAPQAATLSPDADNPARQSYGVDATGEVTAPAPQPAILPDTSLAAARAAQRMLRRR